MPLKIIFQDGLITFHCYFFFRQKLVEEQQRKILKSNHSTSATQQTKRPRSRFSSLPTTPRKNEQMASPRSTHASPRGAHVSQPDHFLLLERRLKSVEAERQALVDLNASMQDENDALKKLALRHDDAGSPPPYNYICVMLNST